MVFSNGDSYEGGILFGKKHGRGKYIYRNGSVFEGDFSNGSRFGFGKFIDKEFRYEGKWENDQMHG